VLLVVDGDESSVGQPVVTDAAVSARVLRQDRGEKTISFKYRPKARSRVKKGHRQELTVLKITDVGSAPRALPRMPRRPRPRRGRAIQGRQGRRQAAPKTPPGEKLKARQAAADEAAPKAKTPKAAPAKEAAPAKAKAPAKERPGQGQGGTEGGALAKAKASPKADVPAKAAPRPPNRPARPRPSDPPGLRRTNSDGP